MRRPSWSRIAEGLVLVAALTWLKLQIPSIGVRLPFLLYFVAVLFAAWRGGRTTAWVSITASVVCANYFFLDPQFAFHITGSTLLQSALFVLEGIALTEISERVAQTRSAAMDAASKLTTTVRSIGDAVIATDIDGRVTFMNPVATELTGWAEEDAKGRPLQDIFEAIDEVTRKRIETPLARVIREGVAAELTATVLVAHETKTETPIDCRAAPIRDDAGTIRGVVLVFHSIGSDRRRAAQQDVLIDVAATYAASLELRATLTRVVESIVPRYADWCALEMVRDDGEGTDPVAVAHVDPSKVSYAEEMRKKYPPDQNATTGVPNVLRTGKAEHYPEIPDELLEKTAVDAEHLRIIRELALRSAIIVPLIARGKTLGALTMVYAESGRRYTEADVAFAQQLADRAALAVDNARLFERERAARETADNATRLKDEFLATLSHELRTPLTAVLGWSRMLADGSLDEVKRAKAVATIDRNASAMAQLVDDLLDVSRIISGKLRIDTQPTALAPIVDAAIESVKPAAQAKEITLETIHDDATPVTGDARRLQQVVWNLLSNAVKFTPRSGRVEIAISRVESFIELRVADNGQGIDPSFLPFVFDRFRQQDASFNRSVGGLGLGLAITRHLVELHGGTIEVKSEGKGKGATFVIRLPIATAPATAAKQDGTVAMKPRADALRSPPPAQTKQAEELRGKKVLVVDDDDDARGLVGAVLARCGCDVVLAGSVAEAMARFDERVPDVIVSDIGMPHEDGIELMKRIRLRSADRGGKVPAAALTAYARADDRRRVLDAGYMTHVVKPVDPAELVAVVASLVRFSNPT